MTSSPTTLSWRVRLPALAMALTLAPTAALLAPGTTAVALTPAAAFAGTAHFTVSDVSSSGAGPMGTVLDADRGLVYTANNDGDSVSVIDSDSGSVLSTVAVDPWPVALAIDSVHDTVWVTSQLNGIVSVIDQATNTVAQTYTVGAGAWGIDIDDSTGTAYVTSATSGTLAMIDTTSGAISTTTVGAGIRGVAVDGATHTAYVASYPTDSVVTVDTLTGAVGASELAVGYGPKELALDPETGDLYVANFDEDSVTVYETRGVPRRVADIPVSAQPRMVTIDSARGVAWVPNWVARSISVIDLSLRSVIATIPVNNGPFQVAVDPSSNTAFVAHNGDDTVSRISWTISPAFDKTDFSLKAVTGRAFVAQVKASGSPPPAYSVTSGTLPPGLLLDAATGAISGVPTRSGTYRFELTASNGSAPDAALAGEIDVEPGLAPSPPRF
ncbi:YncE family protein [Herbiconiux sp. YIM B11900]|uniref:YncE family protein n=1 Tax=Herbiconiux sp. YIM B11900 TaxID=3404131 RepID=UPI003F84FFF3